MDGLDDGRLADRPRRGSGTLEEIAAAIGYQSASAFSTAFKQRVGCPPSDYAAWARRGD